jgi:hypothetical protein
MDNRQWKKIKNSIHFIALSKTCAQNANISSRKIFKSKWPLLKHTISAVHYLLRTLFKDLKLSSVFFKDEQVDDKQTPKVTRKRSKWKKIENSLHFITLSKNCVQRSKSFKTVEDECTESNIKCTEKKFNPNLKRLAQSKWTLLKNTVSIIHFFLRTMFLHLELGSFKVKIGFVFSSKDEFIEFLFYLKFEKMQSILKQVSFLFIIFLLNSFPIYSFFLFF